MVLAADYRFDATATTAYRDTPASMVVCRRDRQAHPLPAGAVLPAGRRVRRAGREGGIHEDDVQNDCNRSLDSRVCDTALVRLVGAERSLIGGRQRPGADRAAVDAIKRCRGCASTIPARCLRLRRRCGGYWPGRRCGWGGRGGGLVTVLWRRIL